MNSRVKAIALHLQEKWGVKSLWHVFIICVVFAITGSGSVKIAAPVLDWIGLSRESMNPWLYWPLRIVLIFPIYQVLLLVVGALFGQFRFFLNIEKRMFGRMLPFLFK